MKLQEGQFPGGKGVQRVGEQEGHLGDEKDEYCILILHAEFN